MQDLLLNPAADAPRSSASPPMEAEHVESLACQGMKWPQADLSQHSGFGVVDIDETEHDALFEKTNEQVREVVGEAVSILKSGPTTERVDMSVARALFPCCGKHCNHQGKRFPMYKLMPVTKAGRTEDLCCSAYNEHLQECDSADSPTLSPKQFVAAVKHVRACYRARLDPEKQTSPPSMHTISFNVYKRIEKEASPEAKKIVRAIGPSGFTKMCTALASGSQTLDMDKLPPGSLPTMQQAIAAPLNIRRQIGEAKLAVISRTTEFCRCIYGDVRTPVAVYIGFVCQECLTMPEVDYDYFVVTGCGQKSGWYCWKGHRYCKQTMLGVLIIRSREERDGGTVFRVQMPSGKVANFLAWAKIMNNIRMGNFPFLDSEISTARDMAHRLRSFVAVDNKVFGQELTKMGVSRLPGHVHALNLDPEMYPAKRVADSPGDITMKESYAGRGIMYYDIGKLFAETGNRVLSQESWPGIVNIITSAWGTAELLAACEMSPAQAEVLGKKASNNLKQWLAIRATGKLTDGSLANQEWQEFAAEPFTW